MILRDLLDLLERIAKTHPEALDASIRARDDEGNVLYIKYVGYDTKHKPARILLEE